MLQEGVGNAVFDDDLFAGFGVVKFAPRTAVDQLRTELFLSQGISPVTETAFGVFHDVAFVNNGHIGLVVVNCVLDGFAHQTLSTFTRNGLDADTRGIGETNFGHAHFIDQKLDQLFRLVALGFVFNTGVNVLRVFAEDHHMGLLWLFQRRRHAFEILHRTQAHIQIEFLAQSHIEGANTASHGGGEWAFDGHHVLSQDSQSFFRQPHIWAINLGRLFTGIDFHPVNLSLTAIGFGNSGIDHFEHDRGDIKSGAVALDIGDDGLQGDSQRHVFVDDNFFALGGHLDMLIQVYVSKKFDHSNQATYEPAYCFPCASPEGFLSENCVCLGCLGRSDTGLGTRAANQFAAHGHSSGNVSNRCPNCPNP